MVCLLNWMMIVPALCLGQTAPQAPAEPSPNKPLSQSVRAVLRTDRTIIPVGSEVSLEFVLQNKSDEPVKLSVPGALPGRENTDLGMGLPLEHVFSGQHFRGLEIESEENPRMGDRVIRKPEYPVPIITLAPFGSVGLRFDVARFYPGLHQSGLYRLVWRPYGGTLESEPLLLHVVQYKQVVMETEYGSLTMELFYDRAPNHVSNFLDLVQRRFYNGKTFHNVFPSQFIIGGCSEGDGTGRRPDGVTLAPEFNDTPFVAGTVGMAIIESDANSASSQFFICLSRQAAWDGRYTAFARIKGPKSLATLQKLGQVETDDSHFPVKPLVIKNMTAVDMNYPPSR